jgi:cell cycle checkpoint protein
MIYQKLNLFFFPPLVRPIDEFREFINKCIYFRSFGQKNTGRVILLDDMPDLTTEDVKQTFHQILLNCLEIVRPFLIVMVVSDSVTDLDTNKSYEKKTNYVNDVLPQDLKESDTRIKEVK